MIKRIFPILAVTALAVAIEMPAEATLARKLPGDHDREGEDRRDEHEDEERREEEERRDEEERREEEERRHEEEERDRQPDCNRDPHDERCSPYYMQPTGTPSPQPTFLYEHNIAEFGESKLFSPDSVTNDYFGFSTAVWEDTVIVGAYQTVPFGQSSNDITGSAFIYDNHDVYNTRLVKSDEDESYFGYAVAVWQNTVVVGAPRADFTNCEDCGAAYVYSRYANGSWILEDELIAQDYLDFHYVGFSVGVYRDFIILGAPGDKGHQGFANTGAAYMFSRDNTGAWKYDQKLSITNDQDDKRHGKEYDHFGSAVAIHGDYALTGAYGEDRNTGAAYVYVHLGFWAAKYKLTARDGSEGDYFGYSVAVHQDIIVVGAYNGDGHWSGAGAAYVFELVGGSGFQQTSKLVAHDGMSSDFFGFSVAIFQNIVIVGAHGEEGKMNEKEGPRFRNKARKLPGGPDGDAHQKDHGENCGPHSAPDCQQFEGQYSFRGTGAGAAYVFKRSGTSWGQVMKIIPAFSEAYDHFGVSVATYNEEFVVGADTADGVVDDTGAAYVYYPTFVTDYDNQRSQPPVVQEAEAESGMFGASSTGAATFAFIVILAPIAMGFVYWYSKSTGQDTRHSKDGLMQLPQDSRHGATVPWSMHGAFDESSWGLESSHSAGVASSGTRAPLRAQASVAK